MQKFLVTGGAGFIGSNICRMLFSQGCFVRVVDNLLTGRMSNLADVIEGIEFMEADMGEREAALAAMKDIDVVLHEGALPSIPRSVDDPAASHRHCVEATFTLLLAARAEKTTDEVVNIACGQAVTVNSIIHMTNSSVGKNVKPVYTDSRPGDVKHSLADVTLAEQIIGFKAQVSFEEGLAEAIAWYRNSLL